MADENIVQTGQGVQNLASSKPAKPLLNVDDDYLVFDDFVTVQYRQADYETNRAGIRQEKGVRVANCPHARRHAINFRDLLNTKLTLKVGDMRVELNELGDITPRSGDEVIIGAISRRVFAVDFDSLANMWIVWCRG